MDVGGESRVGPDDVEPGEAERNSSLNIKDVMEAISAADPEAAAALEAAMSRAARAPGPHVRIVEQPASKALRFRYECEGRSAGSIPGVNSTADRRTYPTIEISGYTGKAVVVVSCVTKDEPFKPHPHNLVGREHCRSGVCTVRAACSDSALVSFPNLGIQCVKRRDIADALKARETLRVDPFRTGFKHKEQPQSIDLNAVRLAFQVFLEDNTGKIRSHALLAISDVIYDKKAMSDLHILRISNPSGAAKGGTEIILLCEKVTREDISVVVYEEQGGVTWEENANLLMVHKQVAIAFTMPPYRDPTTQQHTKVFIQLKRNSDNARSNSVSYTYVPQTQDMDYLKRKRQKTSSLDMIERIQQEQAAWRQDQKPIKVEPDQSPRHLAHGSPLGYQPLEQIQDPLYQQQWLDPMAGPSNFYNQQEVWPATNYVQPTANMQVASISPKIQSRSPNMHANMPVNSPQMHAMSPSQTMSPQGQIMSPHGQVMSPHGQINSPHGQINSPHGQINSPHGQINSPHGQVMSPHGQINSPHGQINSPHGQINSPHGQINSPHGQVMSPNGQVMSPHGQMMSPHGQIMSPQGQIISPHGQMMSPHGQMMSPHGQVLSPHMQAMDDGRCGMSPNMGHVSPNLGQVSPNLAQHNFVQPQQEAQPMENNSLPSLTNLLGTDPEGQILFNSGDLSGLNALLGQYRTNELSESLNRLSTTDLTIE